MLRGMNQEGLVRLFIVCASLVSAFMSSSSYGADSSGPPLSFSNKDLEHYDNPKDRKPMEPAAPAPKNEEVRKARVEDSKEQKEKEYWCKRAAPQRRQIQQLKEEVAEKERELTEGNSGVRVGYKKTRTSQKTLAKTRRRLKSAEEKFNDLEDEAYRKGIPMGWLRCQFE